MKGSGEIILHSARKPKVLLLGNGLLRLCGGINWGDLLKSISGGKELDEEIIKNIPYNMQAEAMCGTAMETIRHDLAGIVGKPDNFCIAEMLKEILRYDFDCILTTNYTYEVENIFLGKEFSESRRCSAIRISRQTFRSVMNLSLILINLYRSGISMGMQPDIIHLCSVITAMPE